MAENLESKRSGHWLSVALRAGLIAAFLWMVKGFLAAFCLGGIAALLLSPLQRRVDPLLGRFRRFTPAVITVGSVILIVIPLVLITIEAAASVYQFFARDWSATIDAVQGFFNERLHGSIERLGVSGDVIRNYLSNLFRQAGTAAAGLAGGVLAAVPQSIVDGFLFVVALYYFLRDGGELTRRLFNLSPFRQGETEALFASIRDTVHGAVLSLFATAGVQGALTTLALFIFGVPAAFLLGILATLLSLVPMVGTTPVTVGAAIYLFAVGRIGAAVGMAIAAVIVGLSDNIVRPLVQSSQGGMHPLIALLSIFGGLDLFGAAGIFIGPVVAAMALWALDGYASRRARPVG